MNAMRKYLNWFTVCWISDLECSEQGEEEEEVLQHAGFEMINMVD